MIHDFDEFKEIPADYDSPINIVVNQMADEIARFTEDGVMQAVVKAGFDIDKAKFVSILQQDRERYQEAYRKGYKDRDGEIVLCKDCKFIDESVKTRFFCGRLMRCVDADWFCADGEIEDEEESDSL